MSRLCRTLRNPRWISSTLPSSRPAIVPKQGPNSQHQPLFEEYGDCGADVITIKELNLAIKTDAQAYLNLEEAQTLWAIRKVFPNGDVPVPELFGWRKYGDRVFIYMSLVPGETLREVWQSLNEDDKASLQNRLKEIIGTLRKLKQSPEIIGECIQCLRFNCPLNHLQALPAEDHYKTVSFG